MSGSITLHPEHGVNPALGMCFWCGGDDGTVLLLGYNKGKEAPRKIVASYDPCKECKDKWSTGILLMEATETATGDQLEFQPGVYVTGGWAVLSEDAIHRLFDSTSADAAIRARECLLDKEAWSALGMDEAISNTGNDKE